MAYKSTVFYIEYQAWNLGLIGLLNEILREL